MQMIAACAAILLNSSQAMALPDCPKSTSAFWSNCIGTYTNEKGTYVGEYLNDKRSGRGTFTWFNGESYVGDFIDDKSKQGTYTWPNGEKYIGGFKDWQMHGHGTYLWPNGEMYVGDFTDDKANGYGIYTLPNGDKYVGEFNDWLRHGQGIYVSGDGLLAGETYVGEWQYGERDGLGSAQYANGDKYVGEFSDNLWNGQGLLFNSDGSMQDGVWQRGSFQGGPKSVPSDLDASNSNPPACTTKIHFQSCIGALTSADSYTYIGAWADAWIKRILAEKTWRQKMSEIGFGGLAVLAFIGLIYIGTPILADSRGRNWKLWLLLTFCLPLIAPIILLLLPIVHKPVRDLVKSDQDSEVKNGRYSSPKNVSLSPSTAQNLGTGTSDKLQKKSYTEDFKREVVSTALTSGETLSSVAAMYDISPTLVRNWKEKYEEEVLATLNSQHNTHNGANMNDNSGNDDDSTASSTLIWHIDRAKFSFSDPSEYKEWKKEKKVFFEFSPSGADDGGETVFVDPDSAEDDFEVTDGRGTIKVKLEKGGPVITAWVSVDAEIVDGLDEYTLSDWANDQGGWASCSIHLGDFDASIEEDDGGDWRFPGNEDN